MDLTTKLKGLAAVGLSTLWQSLLYGFRRDAVDRRFPPERSREGVVGIGSPQGVTGVAGGLDVQFEHARLSAQFLADDLVRITWQPGLLPHPYALARPLWPTVAATMEATDLGWRITTGALVLEVAGSGAISLTRPDGTVLRRDLPPVRTDGRWCLKTVLADQERIYGLGERTHGLDLRGGTYRNWNREPMGAYTEGDDPLYVCLPVYLTMRQGATTLAFFENSFESTFAFGEEATHEFHSGALRYYVAAGTPARCLDRYTTLTGRPAMPPRWALGYHQARWSYMDEEEVRELARGFAQRDLPISAIHLDIHYMDGYRVFTVDQNRFSDLAALTRELGDAEIQTVAILDPGVKQDPDYDVYVSGLSDDAFCKYPDGEVAVGPVWPGNCAFPDFTRPATRDWWGDYYARFVDWGVAGVWHDMNEVAVFAPWGEPTLPLATRHDFDGRGGDHREGHNLYAALEARAGFEGLQRARPHRRPWLLSRSGWAGMQRYSWTWSGDCESDWWTLAQSVRIALSMGLTGMPYSGPDIGGFGGSPSAELYTRWFQAAAFLPFFRTHCAVFAPRREPWVFGEPTLAIVRRFLKLRYRLMPTWYTLAYEASQSGAPLVRPLFYEWPDQANLGAVEDQFLLGTCLLVAPVVAEGASRRSVVLPPGRWFDFWSDELFEGDQEVSVPVTLERIPLFVRDGALLVMEEQGQLVCHGWLSSLESVVGAVGGGLYLDDGDGYGATRLESLAFDVRGGDVCVVRQVQGDSNYPAPDLAVQGHGLTELSWRITSGR